MENEKSFFGRYSYSIIKLFLNQVAIGLFGAVITLALSKIGGEDEALSDTIMIVAGACATVFYLALLYVTTWTVGAKDRISQDVGKLKPMPLRGVLLSLIANVPNIIIATVYTIGEFAASDGTTLPRMAARLATLFIEGMYYGILAGAPVGSVPEARLLNYWWMYFVIIVPAIIVTGVAYYAGTRNFHITKLMEHQYPESDREVKGKKD